MSWENGKTKMHQNKSSYYSFRNRFIFDIKDPNEGGNFIWVWAKSNDEFPALSAIFPLIEIQQK